MFLARDEVKNGRLLLEEAVSYAWAYGVEGEAFIFWLPRGSDEWWGDWTNKTIAQLAVQFLSPGAQFPSSGNLISVLSLYPGFTSMVLIWCLFIRVANKLRCCGKKKNWGRTHKTRPDRVSRQKEGAKHYFLSNLFMVLCPSFARTYRMQCKRKSNVSTGF